MRVDEESPDFPGRKGSTGYFAYRSSKAALGMVARLLDVELVGSGVRSMVLHPGPVQTRLTKHLGKYDGSISAKESVEGLRKQIKAILLRPRSSTTNAEKFRWRMWNGKELQW